MLGYMEGCNQDIDLFLYNEHSFRDVLYTLKSDKMFTFLDKIEEWKCVEYLKKGNSSAKKLGLITIKLLYNTCITVNLVWKNKDVNAFSVISSFDMDIICIAYDIETKQTLNLSQNDGKIAHWNKWNTSFYQEDLWTMGRLLRQFERCVKYHERGYNTDEIVLKYLEIIDKLINYDNLFKNSEKFTSLLEEKQENAKNLKGILELWLEKHTITPEEKELIRKTINTL